MTGPGRHTSSLSSGDIALRDAVDRIFNENFFGNSTFRPFWGNGYNGNGNGGNRMGLALDVYETPTDVVLIAAVPGLGPDNIKVTVHENTVTLTGQLPNVAQSEEAKGATWYLHELPYGAFQRSVTFPMEIEAEGADATFDNGILRLRVPKAKKAQPREITVRQVEPSASGRSGAIDAGKDEVPVKS